MLKFRLIWCHTVTGFRLKRILYGLGPYKWMTYEIEVVAKKLPREPYRIVRKTAISQGEDVNRGDRSTREAIKHIG